MVFSQICCGHLHLIYGWNPTQSDRSPGCHQFSWQLQQGPTLDGTPAGGAPGSKETLLFCCLEDGLPGDDSDFRAASTFEDAASSGAFAVPFCHSGIEGDWEGERDGAWVFSRLGLFNLVSDPSKSSNLDASWCIRSVAAATFGDQMDAIWGGAPLGEYHTALSCSFKSCQPKCRISGPPILYAVLFTSLDVRLDSQTD